MEEGIVIQLQTEALDENIDIETLLRKAYLVARKIQLKDFEKWIQNEQNGYEDDVPDYRKISGEIKAWNPYHGWVPVVANGELADILSTVHMPHPIAVIAEAYATSDGSISLSVNGKITEFLNKNTTAFETNYSFKSTRTELKKILSAVRNRILEWSIVLEENGIIGEGVSFTEKEKNVAQTTPTIVNYTNNFYSNVDNTQIQQGGRGNEICRYGKAWKK